MDFRGRVYPVPPHLNHLGSDLARSMLIFDQAQPLGVDGFSWLKLHCINLDWAEETRLGEGASPVRGRDYARYSGLCG